MGALLQQQKKLVGPAPPARRMIIPRKMRGEVGRRLGGGWEEVGRRRIPRKMKEKGKGRRDKRSSSGR